MKPDNPTGTHNNTSGDVGIPGLFEVLRTIPMGDRDLPEVLRDSTLLLKRTSTRRRPIMPISIEPYATKATPTDRTIAVCMTGHLRTFSMLGVHSSYAHNLLRSTPGVKQAHLYLYGHLGTFHHDGWGWPDGNPKNFPLNETDPALQKALVYPGINLKYVQIHKSGSCEEYMQVDGGIPCPSEPQILQFAWFDRCVRKVFSTGIRYDLVVRTRPDVGICKPIPWRSVSATHISYIWREAGDSGEDWFFTIPSSIIALHWNMIIERMVYGHDAGFLHPAAPDERLPDSIIEKANKHFAVTIVRSPFENMGQIPCKLWYGFKNWRDSEAGQEDVWEEMVGSLRKHIREKGELQA